MPEVVVDHVLRFSNSDPFTQVEFADYLTMPQFNGDEINLVTEMYREDDHMTIQNSTG